MKPYYQDEWVTIYHGDCREILPELPKVDLVLTDPPYGIGLKYGQSNKDTRSVYWDWFLPLVDILVSMGIVTVITHRVTALKYISSWDWVGVWNKPVSMGSRLGNSPILPHWEPIFMWGIYRLGISNKYLSDVITCNPIKGSSSKLMGRERDAESDRMVGHPVPKPETLINTLINIFTKQNDLILDPFLGSGTTAYCAKKLNRHCIGIEIEEKYCEIAAKRCSQSVMKLNV